MPVFYASAAALALAAVCTLGTTSVLGQSPASVGAVRFGYNLDLVATAAGDVYYGHHAEDGSSASWTFAGHIPISSPVIAIGNESGNNVLAYSANGDFFSSTDLGQTWMHRGNVFGAVNTASKTWGRIKAERR